MAVGGKRPTVDSTPRSLHPDSPLIPMGECPMLHAFPLFVPSYGPPNEIAIYSHRERGTNISLNHGLVDFFELYYLLDKIFRSLKEKVVCFESRRSKPVVVSNVGSESVD